MLIKQYWSRGPILVHDVKPPDLADCRIAELLQIGGRRLFAVHESAAGPSRHLAATQQLCLFQGAADIN